MLRFLTAGESHGEALAGILEGFPKGVKISKDFIDKELKRRQSGFGRGQRMQIEEDKVKILSGLRAGISLGSPIAFLIENKDKTIDVFRKDNLEPLTVPRPGHADLAGFLKYQEEDLRNILERASARETAARVVVGSICKQFLELFKINILSNVIGLGKILLDKKNKEELMAKEIERVSKAGDTLGGIIEIIAQGVPAGLGSFMHWDKRLDAELARALVSIPAVKGVEIGLGFQYAENLGSLSHDVISYSKERGFFHKTNNSGGIEGGISTGEAIILRIAMKPIATLGKPLDSIDVVTKKKTSAPVIRSDITAVFACGVVAESMVAFVLTKAFLDKFSSDTLSQIKANYSNYQSKLT